MKVQRPDRRTIAAAIVTYEPDVELLRRNVEAIRRQVARVFILDNGSSNVAALARSVAEFDDVHVEASPRNLGIAAAFNRIAGRAIDAGYRWMVTLDQDSVTPPDMVSTMAEHVSSEVPLVTPYIVDRNKLSPDDFANLNLPPVEPFSRAASKGAITSGGLLSLEVLKKIGGFDERYFIDYVDYDLNIRLMQAGYTIVRANRTYLSHQVGDARPTWLRTPRKSVDGSWTIERFYSFGHSPMRCYYKSRNRILYSRKHWRAVGLRNEGILQIPQQVLLTLLFEDERYSKLKAFARGIRDGMRIPLHPRDAKYL